jgi:hypothetical protein
MAVLLKRPRPQCRHECALKLAACTPLLRLAGPHAMKGRMNTLRRYGLKDAETIRREGRAVWFRLPTRPDAWTLGTPPLPVHRRKRPPRKQTRNSVRKAAWRSEQDVKRRVDSAMLAKTALAALLTSKRSELRAAASIIARMESNLEARGFDKEQASALLQKIQARLKGSRNGFPVSV